MQTAEMPLFKFRKCPFDVTSARLDTFQIHQQHKHHHLFTSGVSLATRTCSERHHHLTMTFTPMLAQQEAHPLYQPQALFQTLG